MSNNEIPNKSVKYLKISCWWGIIADAIMAIQMLFPNLFIIFMKIKVNMPRDFGFGLRYGVPLMVGWTILLFWVKRNPMERKDVLLITLFPVVAGYTVFQIYSIQDNYTTLVNAIPVFILQTAMSVMFIFSYIKAKRFEK